jgi:hypothetical protein
VIKPTHERRLQRVLAALESELLQASDEEVRQAAADIRKRRLDDVFDLAEFRKRWRQRLTKKGPA